MSKATVVSGCCVQLSPDEIGVWEYCQMYQGTLNAGCTYLAFNVCSLCVTMRTMSTRIKELPVKCETKTCDNVFVTIEAAIQYSPIRQKAREAIYSLMNPKQQIESYVLDVVRAEVPKMTMEEVFVNKDAIANAARDKLSKSMEVFGFSIKQVLVTNVEPDRHVKAALNAVEAAVKDRQAVESKAEAHKYVMIKRAQAESQSKALQGQGISRQRAAIVDGLRESLNYPEGTDVSNDVAELLLVTQYFDTLEKVAEAAGTTVFIPAGVSRSRKSKGKGTKSKRESESYGF